MDEQVRRPIVVGVDGSPRSTDALRRAHDLSVRMDRPLRAVTAWHFPTTFAEFPPIEWNPQKDAEQALEDALAAAFGSDVPSGLQRLVVQGQPAKVLVDESRAAEMLVVASRGKGGFAGLLLGSVSSAVAAHAHCPVLITHGEAPESA